MFRNKNLKGRYKQTLSKLSHCSFHQLLLKNTSCQKRLQIEVSSLQIVKMTPLKIYLLLVFPKAWISKVLSLLNLLTFQALRIIILRRGRL